MAQFGQYRAAPNSYLCQPPPRSMLFYTLRAMEYNLCSLSLLNLLGYPITFCVNIKPVITHP